MKLAFSHSLAVLFSALLLAGCATPQPPAPLAAFSIMEYERYDAPGTGAVEGQAFSRTRGGDVKYAAGSEVILTPATNHAVDWAERSYRSEQWYPIDPRAKKYLRVVTGDGAGRFRFERLPAGDYIVLTTIYWQAGQYKTGGFLAKRVTVQEGQTATIVVN